MNVCDADCEGVMTKVLVRASVCVCVYAFLFPASPLTIDACLLFLYPNPTLSLVTMYVCVCVTC